MTWGMVAVGGATLVGGALSSSNASRAARGAADAQTAAAMAGIDEQRRQFDLIQELLAPYVQAGNRALRGQTDLLGINGDDAQRAALEQIQQSPMFTEALRQGEQGILANASATGGLRGGNTQSALMSFRPRLLADAISQRFGQLGNMVGLGQNSAAMTGNAGMATGRGISDLLQQGGAAGAGGILAGARADNSFINSAINGIGYFAGGFGGQRPPSGGTNWSLAGIPSGVEF